MEAVSTFVNGPAGVPSPAEIQVPPRGRRRWGLCSSCGPNATCTAKSCVADDACAKANGGCDSHATRREIGVRAMCTCGDGFVGDGRACTMRLSSLVLAEGYRSPVFSPEWQTYIAVLPVGTLGVPLTAGSRARPMSSTTTRSSSGAAFVFTP